MKTMLAALVLISSIAHAKPIVVDGLKAQNLMSALLAAGFKQANDGSIKTGRFLCHSENEDFYKDPSDKTYGLDVFEDCMKGEYLGGPQLEEAHWLRSALLDLGLEDEPAMHGRGDINVANITCKANVKAAIDSRKRYVCAIAPI